MPVAKSHFTSSAYSIKKLIRVTGIKHLSDSDLVMLDLEAKDWETIYQRMRKQAGEIPTSVLFEWGKLPQTPKPIWREESSHGLLG